MVVGDLLIIDDTLRKFKVSEIEWVNRIWLKRAQRLE